MARFPKFLLKESEHGNSTLTSDDFGLYAPTFHLCHKDGGGHDWQAVAEFLMRSKSRKLANAVSFDTEASLFCAVSDKQHALAELADILCQTFRSKQRLLLAIRGSDSPARRKRPARTKFTTVVVIHFHCYLYDDFEPLIDYLNANLPKEHPLVSTPVGAGETTLYLRTNDADDAISVVKPMLRDRKLLKSAIIAVAARTSTEYLVVHPRRLKTPLVPKLRLCPTIS